jgi:hypothetical protein
LYILVLRLLNGRQEDKMRTGLQISFRALFAYMNLVLTLSSECNTVFHQSFKAGADPHYVTHGRSMTLTSHPEMEYNIS